MSLDTPTSESPPSAYFPEEGDSIVVGIVDVGTYQQRDYDTSEPSVWPDGGPKMGKVITGLTVSATGQTGVGGTRENAPFAAGELVTFWCEGSRYYTYTEALKQAGGVDVGDVMRWVREDDEPAKNPKHNPRKVYAAKIRKPTPEDGDLAERCRAAHNEKNVRSVDAAPAGKATTAPAAATATPPAAVPSGDVPF